MSTPISLRVRVADYLAERRRLGYALRAHDTLLGDFADFVTEQHRDAPITADLMVAWAKRARAGHGTRETWYRRMRSLRPFIRYLQQFEPDTEIPEDGIFGPRPGRVAPHIYHEEEIVALLGATRHLGPPGNLRSATYEALFGLMAATGLRVSEAIHLLERDVDLTSGVLSVRESKCGKSRQVPLHPSAVDALRRFRRRRCREVASSRETPFFTGSCRRGLEKALGDRQVHRVFNQLRDRLGWTNRGAHEAPRLHDLRHTFAVRRLMLWQRDGVDLDQRMLALSTYLGHVKIKDTYWYLTAVPELMALAADTFERFAVGAEGDDA
jgi:site-specific recombinase XerD